MFSRLRQPAGGASVGYTQDIAALIPTYDASTGFSLPQDLLTTLEQEPSVAYVLDENLRIAYCNPAWDRFALENGGIRVIAWKRLGESVLDGMSGPLKNFYEKVYKFALHTCLPSNHTYECSTPKLYRRYRMQVFKIEGVNALVVTHFLELECPHTSGREAKSADPQLYLSSAGLLTMCSNCRRVRQISNSDRWDWVPEYVQNGSCSISHGICPICIHHYLRFGLSAS